MYKENVVDEILSDLDVFIAQWSENREDGESFGDYVIRANIIKPVVDWREIYDAWNNWTITYSRNECWSDNSIKSTAWEADSSTKGIMR